jgi:hypothetical protein
MQVCTGFYAGFAQVYVYVILMVNSCRIISGIMNMD